jgi:hypothetical protein
MHYTKSKFLIMNQFLFSLKAGFMTWVYCHKIKNLLSVGSVRIENIQITGTNTSVLDIRKVVLLRTYRKYCFFLFQKTTATMYEAETFSHAS